MGNDYERDEDESTEVAEDDEALGPNGVGALAESSDDGEEESPVPEQPRAREMISPPPQAQRKPGRPPKGKLGRPAGVGASQGGRNRGRAGEGPSPTAFDSSDAVVLWPEVMQRLTAMGKSAYDLAIRVERQSPQPAGPVGYAFDAAAVIGDQTTSPGDALLRYVTEFYHLASPINAPALYILYFVWKTTGQIFARGRMQLQSRAELQQMRAAEAHRQMMEGGAPFSGPGVGYMPMGQMGQMGQNVQYMPPPRQQPQPQQAPPPAGAPPINVFMPAGLGGPAAIPPPVYAPPPQPAGESEELRAMRAELEGFRQREQLRQMREQVRAELEREYQRQGWGPRAQPGALPGLGAMPAAAPPASTAEIVQQVVAQLRPLLAPGVARPGVGAPPEAPAAGGGDIANLRKMLKTVQEVRALAQEIDGTFGDEGDPEATGTGAAPAEPSGEDLLGVKTAQLPGKWKDGRPMIVAAKKKSDGSTGLDVMGTVLANPAIIEEGMGLLARFGPAIAKIAEAAGSAGVGGDVDQQPQQLPPQEPPRQLSEGAPTAPAQEEEKIGW